MPQPILIKLNWVATLECLILVQAVCAFSALKKRRIVVLRLPSRRARQNNIKRIKFDKR